MCTATFLPLPGGGYLLATNRDERPGRAEARPPERLTVGARRVLAPIDGQAGGTWVGVDDLGRCVCVLNGDRPAQGPEPVDPRSRGLLVLDLLADAEPESVAAELERRASDGTLVSRPFKLICCAPDPGGARLVWLQWDGASLARDDLSSAAVFVSSTFEPDRVEDLRRVAFTEALATVGSAGVDDAAARQLAWHRGHAPGAEAGDAYSVCMHRPDANSRSVTQVEVTAGAVRMRHGAGQPCSLAGGALSVFELEAAEPTVGA